MPCSQNLGRIYAESNSNARALREFICAFHYAPHDEALLVVVQRFWLAAVRGELDKLEL